MVRVTTDGGHDPAWSRDGHEIYWWQNHDILPASMTESAYSLDIGKPTRVYSSAYNVETFGIAPDGRLLVATRELEPWTHPLNVVVGWKAGAERLLGEK